MQHFSSTLQRLAARSSGGNGAPGLNNGAAPHPSMPLTGIYGSGKIVFFPNNTVFTVPTGVLKIRVRLWGAGATALGDNGGGGGGGGFALGEFNVVPGQQYAVTVGAGTSSFGALMSATAGSGINPGIGIGGDLQSSGGKSRATRNIGGGGVGGLLGPGGSVFTFTNGSYVPGGAGHVGGAGAGGRVGIRSLFADVGQAPAMASLDFIGLGGGNGGPGGGGAPAGNGGIGTVNGLNGFPGGFPGGGGGGTDENTSQIVGGAGALGFGALEY